MFLGNEMSLIILNQTNQVLTVDDNYIELNRTKKMFLSHSTFFLLKEKNIDFITEGENILANIIFQFLQLKQ
jgi:hypothetical protein